MHTDAWTILGLSVMLLQEDKTGADVEEVDANEVLTEGVGDCACKDDVLKVLAVTLLIVDLLVDCIRTEGRMIFGVRQLLKDRH